MTKRLVHVYHYSFTSALQLESYVKFFEEEDAELCAFGAEHDPSAHRSAIFKLEPLLQRVVHHMWFKENIMFHYYQQ